MLSGSISGSNFKNFPGKQSPQPPFQYQAPRAGNAKHMQPSDLPDQCGMHPSKNVLARSCKKRSFFLAPLQDPAGFIIIIIIIIIITSLRTT